VELGTFKSCGLTYVSGMDAYLLIIEIKSTHEAERPNLLVSGCIGQSGG